MCELFAAAPSNGIRQSSEYSSLGPESTSKEMPLVSDKDSLAWISAPLLPRQRRDWRDKIGGCWKWSEALPGRPASTIKMSPYPTK